MLKRSYAALTLFGALEVASGLDIVNPHLVTDRSVDTSSPEAMVKSLVKPGMSDREKALAVYNFVRRTMFHYRYLTTVAGGGTMDLINGIGYCLCTPTAGTQARLGTLCLLYTS
ncbi:MAG: transglutaminase-like domain-containing protein, partial [Kiritimatiellae bacterium]|nr:transglutaminase-like domain-containing protein [Kiritimatiellia bacterium]